MYLFKNKYLSQVLDSYVNYFLKISLLCLAVSLFGCMMDSSAHRPPIEGDIDISKDREGNLCFMPILSSATMMGDPTNLKHIKMEYLAILDPKSTGGDRIKIKIEPINGFFSVLQKNQKICLNSDNPELEQTVYATLDTQSLSVLISGLDDKKEHSISFHRDFNYPYIAE